MYNQAIRDKINELYPTYPLPNAAYRTFCFVDGTRQWICVPDGLNVLLQARVYNGHDHIHCLQWQTLSFPDGMIGDVYGPLCGACHDQYMNHTSQVNARLAACQIGQPFQGAAYKDKAYINQTHGIAAHRAPPLGVLPPHLALEIEMMSTQRVGVEWEHERIFMNTSFLNCCVKQKIQLRSVADYYICGCLFANICNCIYGHNGLWWGIRPPKLGQCFVIIGFACDDDA